VADSSELDPSTISGMLAGLQPGAAAHLLFLRRAPAGLGGRGGTLLCLSASFNPITVAHDSLVREASRMIPPQEVLLLLATANVDKGVSGLPLGERLALLLRFAESRPGVSVAAVGPGRFVDKMEAIHHAYGTGIRLVFLVGFDTLVRLFDPKYYSDRDTSLSALFSGSECVAATRGPHPSKAMEAFLTRPDVLPYAGRIHVIQLPLGLASVSATEVRAKLARGEPINRLVPEELRKHVEAGWKRIGAGSRPEKPPR